MYGQPWEKGVQIRIPREKIKTLIDRNINVFAADPKTKEILSTISLSAKLSLHYVAYTNNESRYKKDELETFTCGKEQNQLISPVNRYTTLAGYLKDNAWSYEKEARLRVNVNDNVIHNGVKISIPSDILDSFEFITGPRFEGNLYSIFEKNQISVSP